MPEYGPIKWIDYYWEVPQNAEYLVREDSHFTVRLELLRGLKSSVVLKLFDAGSLEKDIFESTLTECRKIIGNEKTMWVEKPIWKWIKDNRSFFNS